jgi:hypothetical protein
MIVRSLRYIAAAEYSRRVLGKITIVQISSRSRQFEYRIRPKLLSFGRSTVDSDFLRPIIAVSTDLIPIAGAL